MTNPRFDRLSPAPGIGLEAYPESLALRCGESVDVMVSAPIDGQVDIDVVRLVHGDRRPAGPGLREQVQSWGAARAVPVSEQLTDYGSYVEVPNHAGLVPAGSFTFGVWHQPTKMGGWHSLASLWAPGELGFGLWVAGSRILVAGVSHDGETAEWTTGFEHVQEGRWQLTALTFDADTGALGLHQYAPSAVFRLHPSRGLVSLVKQRTPGAIHTSAASLLLGATESVDGTEMHWAHYNGRLASPALFETALDRDQLEAWAMAESLEAAGLGVEPMARWDFSVEPSSAVAYDVSGNGRHGKVVNAPGRLVKGPAADEVIYGDGTQDAANRFPHLYDALHMHENDLDDAAWEPTHRIEIPRDAPSGLYAAKVDNGREQVYVPIVVRPEQPAASLAVLLPTFTWTVYGSNRLPTSWSEDGVMDRTRGAYEDHTDQSVIHYATSRKPTRSWQPWTGVDTHGGHTIENDLYLINWLVDEGIEHDTICDHHFHADGASALEPYGCIIIVGHAEYWSETMVRGLHRYLRHGGRVVYLAGNGLCFVTSADPNRSWLLEVRRPIQPFVPWPDGENTHSTTGEVGGRWHERGLGGSTVTGVDITGQYFRNDLPAPGFRRLPVSFEDRWRWVFDGVVEDPIGEYGLNLGSAASFEMDGVIDSLRSDEPDRASVVLARSAFAERMINDWPAGTSDIGVTPYPNGGGVFFAGAVSWVGSLSHDGGDNGVATITRNVLRRFLETPPGKPLFGPAR